MCSTSMANPVIAQSVWDPIGNHDGAYCMVAGLCSSSIRSTRSPPSCIGSAVGMIGLYTSVEGDRRNTTKQSRTTIAIAVPWACEAVHDSCHLGIGVRRSLPLVPLLLEMLLDRVKWTESHNSRSTTSRRRCPFGTKFILRRQSFPMRFE